MFILHVSGDLVFIVAGSVGVCVHICLVHPCILLIFTCIFRAFSFDPLVGFGLLVFVSGIFSRVGVSEDLSST